MISTLYLASVLQLAALDAETSNVQPQREISELSSNQVLEALPTIEVSSERYEISNSIKSSLSSLTAADIKLEAPKHPNEVFDRIPGAWISSGSGQEHLTAIRSPVLTGAGACGAFMVLEDQVPTRPSGFCNVNQMFEVNISQARQINVLRGPGTVTYGSNALHGAINVFTPGPAIANFAEFGFEAGSYDYFRGRIAASGERIALQATFTDSGSFRDDEQFQHGLFNLQVTDYTTNYTGRTSFAYANLDQDTAGFILGKNSYKNRMLRTKNLNPDAFREAWAARLSSRRVRQTSAGHELEFIPYARSSRMDFLQHFLPGTPLETNGQDSAGLLFNWTGNAGLSAGADLEWAEGVLVEFQENPIETGSDFLKETRPQGYHYDYEVQAVTAAAWIRWQGEISNDWELTAGLRAEYISYDYDNRMPDGNTRDDGTECGFGGCLYTRPSDRRDSFTNLSPELGLSHNLDENRMIYLRIARGYRAPQATELYRLQRGQTVADLDPETLDSVEVGFKGFSDKLNYEVTAYMMWKDNFIFRDADGFNISDGKTRHLGIEALLRWQFGDEFAISGNLSWAQHEYDFNRDLGRGEVIIRGNEIDTAPPWLGALRLQWQPDNGRSIEAEWIYQGEYFIDAANAHDYPGHMLLNLRSWWNIAGSRHGISVRLTNILDERYAERADYAFGNYRYFPGAGRRINVEWIYRR